MSSRSMSFLNRNLESYPTKSSRIWYLALSVAATFVLYYESYVLPSVAPLVLTNFHISFGNYIYLIVVANLLGAVASLLGSLSDRLGRANLVVYGVLITSLITLVTAFANSGEIFVTLAWLLGFVEGIILVATPALVRDFSPRLGRATAMAFWTVGPVGGSLLATTVASQTLSLYGTWQSQYVIASLVGLVISVLCFVGLRDLSSTLRSQIMLAVQESTLLEARAKGIDVESTVKHPWRQMLRPRVTTSAFGVSVFLLLYYALVSYTPILFTSIFKYSLNLANGLLAIYWIVDIVSSIIGGIISDRLEVRKPFIVVGTILNMIVALVFISRIGQPTSPTFMGILLGISGFVGPMAYVAWMAGYTEMIEDVNPALVATGIAVWGFIIRIVVVISTLAFGFVVVNTQMAGQWATWWWICVGGMVVFIPTAFLIAGYWSPARARAATKAKLVEEGLSVESVLGSA